MGRSGLTLIARPEAALDRLRRRGPEIRAAAGRHALGLRAVEAALRGAPSMFLRAELHELYDVVPADLEALCDPARLDVWPSLLDRGRILATEHHGGTLADAVVGRPGTHRDAAESGDVGGALPRRAAREIRPSSTCSRRRSPNSSPGRSNRGWR